MHGGDVVVMAGGRDVGSWFAQLPAVVQVAGPVLLLLGVAMTALGATHGGRVRPRLARFCYVATGILFVPFFKILLYCALFRDSPEAIPRLVAAGVFLAAVVVTVGLVIPLRPVHKPGRQSRETVAPTAVPRFPRIRRSIRPRSRSG